MCEHKQGHVAVAEEVPLGKEGKAPASLSHLKRRRPRKRNKVKPSPFQMRIPQPALSSESPERIEREASPEKVIEETQQSIGNLLRELRKEEGRLPSGRRNKGTRKAFRVGAINKMAQFLELEGIDLSEGALYASVDRPELLDTIRTSVSQALKQSGEEDMKLPRFLKPKKKRR